MFDFGNQQAAPPAPAAADDDEWAFSSALPEGLPASNTIQVSETALSISLHAAREPQTPSVITMSITFSSKSDQPISELTFMAAVTKVQFLLPLSYRFYRLSKFKDTILTLLRATPSNSSHKQDAAYNLTNKAASSKSST